MKSSTRLVLVVAAVRGNSWRCRWITPQHMKETDREPLLHNFIVYSGRIEATGLYCAIDFRDKPPCDWRGRPRPDLAGKSRPRAAVPT
jgi:hypothetical protein